MEFDPAPAAHTRVMVGSNIDAANMLPRTSPPESEGCGLTGSYEAKTRRDEDTAIMQIIQKAILAEGGTAATVSCAVCERIDVDLC